MKAKGPTTTDQISPAGAWLRYRGHLERISHNMFGGVLNAFTGEEGSAGGAPLHQIARTLNAAGTAWVVFGDENYGEGSAREHAAMSPRYLGCAAVIARSFARIHEANLKKQGILALSLRDAGDYDAVRTNDRVSVLGLRDLAPGRAVRVRLEHVDGSRQDMSCAHTLTREEIEWFREGSLLNWIRRNA